MMPENKTHTHVGYFSTGCRCSIGEDHTEEPYWTEEDANNPHDGD